LEKSVFFRMLEKYAHTARRALRDKIKLKTGPQVRVSPEDYAENYRQMISLLEEKGVGCIIVIPPADIRRGYMEHYLSRAAILRSVAAGSNVPVIGPQDPFIRRPAECFLEDGFHLTVFGNTLVAEAIVPAVKEYRKSITAD
ncbi:MAG: SGNH/GDSL hydrolase family protein, partial [Candidatus Omnitrophica bacterium]|nr:SGNH/GDSL hydrolase family protein [Candidatus Omnitrophota bacterium]